MASFTLKEVIANGTAQVLENGSLIQTCVLIISIEGIASQGKTISEIVDFEVENNVMSNTQEPLVVAWTYIKEVLAPQWLVDNFSNI